MCCRQLLVQLSVVTDIRPSCLSRWGDYPRGAGSGVVRHMDVISPVVRAPLRVGQGYAQAAAVRRRWEAQPGVLPTTATLLLALLNVLLAKPSCLGVRLQKLLLGRCILLDCFS